MDSSIFPSFPLWGSLKGLGAPCGVDIKYLRVDIRKWNSKVPPASIPPPCTKRRSKYALIKPCLGLLLDGGGIEGRILEAYESWSPCVRLTKGRRMEQRSSGGAEERVPGRAAVFFARIPTSRTSSPLIGFMIRIHLWIIVGYGILPQVYGSVGRYPVLDQPHPRIEPR